MPLPGLGWGLTTCPTAGNDTLGLPGVCAFSCGMEMTDCHGCCEICVSQNPSRVGRIPIRGCEQSHSGCKELYVSLSVPWFRCWALSKLLEEEGCVAQEIPAHCQAVGGCDVGAVDA